jgi:Domain of Unknown Function with PDB structure (DUF3857)
MSTRWGSSLLSFAGLLFLITPLSTLWSISFQPVSAEELKMTSEPKAAGAPAIILFREVDRDDRGLTAHEDVYFRIKILTEEGRKYADIEIPFFKEQSKIVNIHARTIKPDGTIVDFNGKAFDKSIVKARGLKYMAKTFTMPDVQMGSVLEYYYTEDLAEYLIFDSHWILSNELFTKKAKFTLNPYTSNYAPVNLRWTWHLLPPGTVPPAQAPNRVVSLEAADIPAFQTEDYMPPENELKSRVDFIYSEDAFEKDADKYWKKFGTKFNGYLEGYVGKRKAMESALSQITSPSDSPETKLQKIYTRVQQVRNTSYALEKTQQEQKRDKEKLLSNVEEVWKKQYGEKWEINWLFLGLVRAAGFEASGMWVSDRRNYFFSPQTMEGRRLDENVVVVKLNGKDLFFDPGAEFTPFGMLPWVETSVQGLKLDKDGGTWALTSLPQCTESAIQRKAELKLSDTGDLEGKLVVTYTGLEASQRRVDQRFSDDAAHKKFLEDEVKEAIPVGSEVELTSQPDWKNSASPLVAEYTLKVPGWISAAGRRALLPVGLFSAPEKHLFDHANRVHPIYFEFPFQRSDDITIDLPLGWQISSVPEPHKLDAKAITYNLEAKNEEGALHLNRVLNVDVVLLPKEHYETLRKIFQVVRTVDEEQVALLPGTSTGSN